MLPSDSPERPSAKVPGGLSTILLRLMTKRATVVANERLANRFRLITLEGAALEGVAWTPGQKMQVVMRSALVTRTYTPIEWNAATGRACLLGYVHGDGPGSVWLDTSVPGDECDIFGPRGSLDLLRLPGSLVVFGDDTSIGLAYAAAHHLRERPVSCHFVVDDAGRVRDLLEQIDIRDAALSEKRTGKRHLETIAAPLPALAEAGASFVLTGEAGFVQSLHRSLKWLSVPATRIAAKAYWAPGKNGMTRA